MGKLIQSMVEWSGKPAVTERMHVIMTSIFKAGYGEVNEFVGRLSRAGMDLEQLRLVNEDASLAERMVRSLGEEPAVPDIYRIAVDWNRTLAQMIGAGNYDWVNSNITQENFPLIAPSAEASGPDAGPYRTSAGNGSAETEAVLVRYGKRMTTMAVEADLDRRGLRPATCAELLALGEKHPDLQRRFLIVALGSFWVGPGGYRGVPYLYGGSGRRRLCLGWDHPDGEWDGHYRFLAVRKS